MKSIFGSFIAKVVSLVLVLEIAAYYAYPKTENTPLSQPLSELPQQMKDWRMTQEVALDTEVAAVLQADDTLNRTYVSNAGKGMTNLFLAFFKSQRTGVAPHSPKVCLPGAGWVPSKSEILEIPVGGNEKINVNSYLVARGEYKSVVLYWYQSPGRAIASEYEAKIFTVLDSLRYRRSDTSLVRIIQAVDDSGEEATLKRAITFTQDTYPTLRKYLPHL